MKGVLLVFASVLVMGHLVYGQTSVWVNHPMRALIPRCRL